MKTVLKLSLSSLLLINAQAFALNPVQGWYAGLILGVSYPQETTVVPTTSFVTPVGTIAPQNASLSYGVMGGVGGQIGYRCEHFRVEGEALYNNNPYDILTIGDYVIKSPSTSSTLRMQGATNSGFFLINGFYDLYTPNQDNVSQVVPYIGLGAGYSYVQNNITLYYNDTELYRTNLKATFSRPAGQAIVGISYFMDDFTTFGLDFRYLQTTSITNNNRPRINGFDTSLKLYSINLLFNGSFDFG